MILVSVGTQFPFDRLISTVDMWAVENGRTDVMAQTGPSGYTPRALKCFDMMSPDKFRKLQAEAELIVAHAGMGSILTALEFRKPIIIMPRDHTRGEHRNEHQSATAARFENTPGLYVVRDEAELLDRLNHLSDMVASQGVSRKAPEEFVSRLRAFIEEERPSSRVWTLPWRRNESSAAKR